MLEAWDQLWKWAHQHHLDEILIGVGIVLGAALLTGLWLFGKIAGRGLTLYWRWSYPPCDECHWAVPVWFVTQSIIFVNGLEDHTETTCHFCLKHEARYPSAFYWLPLRYRAWMRRRAFARLLGPPVDMPNLKWKGRRPR